MIISRTDKHIYVQAEEGYELYIDDEESFECAYLPIDFDLTTILERATDDANSSALIIEE